MKSKCVIFPIGLLAVIVGCASGGVNGEDNVFLTGNEQSVINSFIEQNKTPVSPRFDNSLDHVLAVLLARAYPKPSPRKLAESAVAACCEEFQKQTRKEIPMAQRESWISTAVDVLSFKALLNDIAARGEEGLDRDRLVEAGLKGMMRGTGWDGASLLNQAQAAWLKEMMETRENPAKERGVLGIKLDGASIIDAISGTPAAEAGLLSGDVIININAKSVMKESTNEVIKSLAGAPGETVVLTIKRDEKTFPVELRRISAAAAGVRAEIVHPKIVHISIPSFEGSGVADRVKQIVRQQIAAGASALVFDLRDNPGGRPEEANAVADIFLDNQTLQIFEFRSGKRIVFRSHPGAEKIEVIVLTNKNTGSAAEMLAMALHDNARATIVGQTTAGALCGKDGEILKGDRTILFRSEPTILSPNGKDYSSTGIPPDIVVDPINSGEDILLQRAIELAREKPAK